MQAKDLVVGATYFMLTYPDPSMTVPIVVTYRYLGKDLVGRANDGPTYFFRHLPTFQLVGEELEEDSTAFSWPETFPNLFAGWGEDVPTAFDEDALQEFESLDGLIDQLQMIRNRVRRGDG